MNNDRASSSDSSFANNIHVPHSKTISSRPPPPQNDFRRQSTQRNASSEALRPSNSSSTASLPGGFGNGMEEDEEESADWGGDLMDVNDDEDDWSMFFRFLFS